MATSRRNTLVRMKEKELLETIKSLAKLTGWLIYHTYDSRKSPEGFPDLVLVKPPDVIFVELKTDIGRLREKQKIWLEWLKRSSRVKTFLWTPQDWWNGTIAEILTGTTQRRYK